MQTSVRMEPNWSEKQAGQTLDNITNGLLHTASSNAMPYNGEPALPQTTAIAIVYNLRE